MVYARGRGLIYRICLTTQQNNAFLDLPFRSVETVQESNDVFRFLTVDPIRVGVICYNKMVLATERHELTC